MTKHEDSPLSTDFWGDVESFVAKRGRGSRSLAGVIDAWDSFVQRVAEGYLLDWTEFSNDVRARTFLEEILIAFAGSSDLTPFMPRIEAIDNRFRSLLLPGVVVRDSSLPWWERGILRSARGHQYAEEVHRLFGIKVEEK